MEIFEFGENNWASSITFGEEKLILAVQEHTILYDTTHLFYKDTNRKENAWCKVAEVTGLRGKYMVKG